LRGEKTPAAATLTFGGFPKWEVGFVVDKARIFKEHGSSSQTDGGFSSV
jgi:hypothetical protein